MQTGVGGVFKRARFTPVATAPSVEEPTYPLFIPCLCTQINISYVVVLDNIRCKKNNQKAFNKI